VKIARYRVLIKVLVAWVLCLGALIGVHFGLVLPHSRAVADSNDAIQAAVERFTLLSDAKSEREQARRKTRQDELEYRLAEYVFSPSQLNQLDFELRGLSEKNHLTDFSARHVRTTSKVGATEIKRIAQREMILSFKSTFPDFLRFINELERHYPIVLVDSFSPTTMKDRDGLLSCTMECSLLYETRAR
jgi:hypothetical protein